MRIYFGIAFCLTIWSCEFLAAPQEKRLGNDIVSNNVIISRHCVTMPLNKILLIRKDKHYCAIKFLRYWTGKTDEDHYATYESYYQCGETKHFRKDTAKFREGNLSSPKIRGIGRLAFSFGQSEVKCGPIHLFWTAKTIVYLFQQGINECDYNYEFAPTIWDEISKVNLYDPRIVWYRCDYNRERRVVPIDELWK